jgi:hypothetical protein
VRPRPAVDTCRALREARLGLGHLLDDDNSLSKLVWRPMCGSAQSQLSRLQFVHLFWPYRGPSSGPTVKIDDSKAVLLDPPNSFDIYSVVSCFPKGPSVLVRFIGKIVFEAGPVGPH